MQVARRACGHGTGQVARTQVLPAKAAEVREHGPMRQESAGDEAVACLSHEVASPGATVRRDHHEGCSADRAQAMHSGQVVL